MRSNLPIGPARRLALVGLMALIFLAVSGALPVAAKDRPPGGVLTNPVVRAIDLASPAVVRIATIYSVQITMSACGLTATLPKSGAYDVGGLGSGAFVSAHGDVLTADHVVNIDRRSLDGVIFTGQRVSVDVAAFLNAACHPAVPVTPSDVANGIVQYNGFPYSTSYSPPRVLVWRSTSYLGVISGASSTPATTLEAGLLKAPFNEASVVKSSAFGQNDLALLHVDLSDTPSIQLASSRQLAVEDTLAVIGFPGNGDFNGDPTNLLTPSVNNVSVSALKRNDNGSQLIQVGGNVEHGDSGGPALDVDGHIVGIVSFGGIDQQGITAFLRSSDNALELLSAAGIDTTPGTFQKLWQQAFADYMDTAPGHWGAAAREMDALGKLYPEFHGLDSYRAYADNAAVRESSSSSSFSLSGLSVAIIAVVVVGILLLLLLLVVFISLRNRARRAKQQAAPAPMAFWPASGAPQGYNGAAMPGYQPGMYNAPAQPTRPSTPQQYPSNYPPQTSPQYPQYPQYPQASSPAYAPTLPSYAPPGNGSQGAASLPRSNAEPIPTGTAAYDTHNGHDARDVRPPVLSEPTARDGSRDNAVLCVNGHQMPLGAFRCLACGAERAQSTASTPGDARAPWSQTW